VPAGTFLAADLFQSSAQALAWHQSWRVLKRRRYQTPEPVQFPNRLVPMGERFQRLIDAHHAQRLAGEHQFLTPGRHGICTFRQSGAGTSAVVVMEKRTGMRYTSALALRPGFTFSRDS